jgi:hypothetical protein
MEIMVVSSSSVSMYSIYPFETNSCQPSSGVSWIKEAYEKKYSNIKLNASQQILINVRPFVAMLGYAPF